MNDVLFSSKSVVWETPQDLFDKLNAEFHFDLDVCALPENAKCKRYYTPEDDGLSQPWNGVCWCNPPYGRTIGKWVQKAYETFAVGVRSLCFFLQEQIQNGFMNTYIIKQR